MKKIRTETQKGGGGGGERMLERGMRKIRT